MTRNIKKKEAPVITRAEKKDATKQLIRELLEKKEYKHNDLIDEVAKLYAQRFEGDDTDNINDVKGRVGSVLDIMKKESDVRYEGGMYALNVETPVGTPMEMTAKTEEKTEEKSAPKKATRSRAKKAAEKTETPAEVIAEKAEKAETVKKETVKAKKTTKKSVKATKEEKKEEEPMERIPLPAAPIQPITPVAPITPETSPEPMPEAVPEEEKPAPKKRGRKPKKTEETAAAEPVKETVLEEVKKTGKEENQAPMVELNEKTDDLKEVEKPVEQEAKEERKEEKKEIAAKGVVMDMSFLFNDRKPVASKPAREAREEKMDRGEQKALVAVETAAQPIKEEKKEEQKAIVKTEVDRKPAPTPVKTIVKETEKQSVAQKKTPKTPQGGKRRVVSEKTMTADEKLREAFLKKIRSLGGDYFEYYSVYLLERYSMRNGRRLEGLKITGGDHDGGIDGEIELTDKFGFRETIYIQSKNWDPDKGDEKLWVVGETLLQQFVGACMCRQAKDGKQHSRGIFITTSRFTPDAKHLLDAMSDKIIGYDGNDLYETAKECEFGLIRKNGEWVLDERILSGGKAFFNLF